MNKCIRFLIVFLLFVPGIIYSQNIIEGRVTNSHSKDVIMYVNIGLLNKNIGTVSNSNGYYLLNIEDQNLDDSVRFSCIGYEPETFLVKDLLLTNDYNIELIPKAEVLPEIVVNPANYQYKVLGNHFHGKKIMTGFRNNDKGSECGILINTKEKSVLDKLTCNIAECTYDSIFYRINVYEEIKKGQYNNILTEPIYFSQAMNDSVNSIEIDLLKYNIIVKGKTLITIEHVKDLGEGHLMFPGGFVFGTDTYYRKASEGIWMRSKINMGFNVAVYAESKR